MYLSTFTLTVNTTYYWHVATTNGLFGASGPWSQIYSFVVASTPPVQAGAFVTVTSSGALLPEGAVNGLAIGTTDQIASLGTGVTAQIVLQAGSAGLAVSTSALVFSGDGHDNPAVTGGWGVAYSSNAGQRWVDYSRAAVVQQNFGTAFSAMAVFAGNLFVADAGGGRVYYYNHVSNVWDWCNHGSPINGVASQLRAFVNFNNRLYVGDGNGGVFSLSAADPTCGGAWTQSISTTGVSVRAITAFNGKLYIGDGVTGRIYVSTDGLTWPWSAVQAGGQVLPMNNVQTLAVFNSRLFAGDAWGRI